MRPFWRAFWASILAYIVLSIIAIVFINVIIFSISSSFLINKELKIKENTVLEMNLNFKIGERKGVETTNNFNNPFVISYGIQDIKNTIEKASEDDNIKGILLNFNSANIGMSNMDDLRSSIAKFKSKNKFVIAYSESYSLGAYYLTSVADEIFLYPEGVVDFRGLSSEIMFFKNALDDLGVDVKVVRGSNNIYKSAVEPFMYDKMSPDNREQITKLLNDIWRNIIHKIKDERDISLEKLNEIADSLYCYNAAGCLNYKLIDNLIYRDQLDSIMKSKITLEENDDINMVSFKKYLKKSQRKNTIKEITKKGNIAIVYAVGEIISGESQEGKMGSETIVKAINKAKNDSLIKAVVLRVNSPGGSALASDVIWRALELTKKEKPVVVSMGDLAASGGYYISCGADRIFAGSNTITGSIGVFGVIPNLENMLNEKVGITFDRVETNEHASFSIFSPLDKKEMDIIQKGVDEIYTTFITKVAQGRDGLKKNDVNEIARGRVWSGKEALDLELIDEIGDMNSAINYAANKVGIETDKVEILEYPERKNDEFMELLSELEFNGKVDHELNELIADFHKYYKTIIKPTYNRERYLTLFPFEIKIY